MSLERSIEWDRDAECKAHKKDREHDKTHDKCRDRDHEVDHSWSREKDRHRDCTTGHEHSMLTKHGWSDEFGDPLELHHSKE